MEQIGSWEAINFFIPVPPTADEIIDVLKIDPYGPAFNIVARPVPPASGLYGFNILPDDQHILLNEGTPQEDEVDINGLPPGFRATDLTFRFSGDLNYAGAPPGFELRLDGEVAKSGPWSSGSMGSSNTMVVDVETPTLWVSLPWELDWTPGPADTIFIGAFYATGNYSIVLFWWTIPEVDACGERHEKHYKLSAEQPIAPTGEGTYERLDPDDDEAAPQPIILAIEPSSGWTAGSTAVTIKGDGFGDDAQVFFDGVPATDVVVVSAKQITCIAPPHAAGYATVTVINADGVSS